MNPLKYIKLLFKRSFTITKSQNYKMMQACKALQLEPIFKSFHDEELQKYIEENTIYNQDKVELNIVREPPVSIKLPLPENHIRFSDLSKMTLVDEKGRSYVVLCDHNISPHPHLMGDYKQLSLTIIDEFDLAK